MIDVEGPDELSLPAWAVVTTKRAAHIRRVVALLDTWSEAIGLAADESLGWRDAGAWHDALRDADEAQLRAWSGDQERPTGMLHGFAAARRLDAEGERRQDVLDAIRWHTVGHASWNRTGRALYMADFLEPGRTFMQPERAFLASLVPQHFDEVFRHVVRLRIEWALREGKALAPETVGLWNAVR